MRSELLLAKNELELKRMTEMANLREALGVIPKVPFESQPIRTLNAWVSLQIIDARVLVLDAVKPFSDYGAMVRHKVAGLLPEKETLDYIQERLKDKKSLPIRIDIYYKAETSIASERLRDAIIALAREANADMDTEVRLELATFVGTGTSTFFLREGRITTFYAVPVRRPDGGPKLLTSGQVDPNDLEQSILWRVTKPKNLPLTFRIEYDESSSKLAKQVADTARAVAKRLGVAELVQVAGVLVEPVPETVFLGRWEALGKGHLRTIDIQSRGVCQVLMGEGSEAIKPGTSVKGIWLLTTKEIFVDINDKAPGKPQYVYRGNVDEEGHLVLDRGDIQPQGSFSGPGGPRMVLRKVQ